MRSRAWRFLFATFAIGALACVGGIIALSALLGVGAAPVEAPTLFAEHRADFVQLRDLIRDEPRCTSVTVDHYEWLEPCDASATDCLRWVDEAPTADVLARLCDMPGSRAHAYLALMARTGVTRVIRDRPAAHGVDEVLMIVEVHGIVTSGGETDIVWRRERPPATSGSAAMGSSYVALPLDDWYVKYEWD